MKKVILPLLLAGILVFFCACAGNAPEPVSTPAEPTPEIISNVEPTPEIGGDGGAVEPYPAATPEEAVQFLVSMPPRAFGLAEPYDDYEVLYVEPDRVQQPLIEGVDYYTMELHVSYPGGVEVLTLSIRTDLGAIYHYDDESGNYHEVTPYDYYCPQESPQSDNSGAQNSAKSEDVPKKNDAPQSYEDGSAEATVAYLRRYSKNELGLPADLDEYVVKVDGQTEINGIRCYDVGVYADLGERMELMNTYWVAFDNSVVFATDLQTGGYKALPSK